MSYSTRWLFKALALLAVLMWLAFASQAGLPRAETVAEGFGGDSLVAEAAGTNSLAAQALPGELNTELRIQNRDGTSASVFVSYVREDGTVEAEDGPITLDPRKARFFFTRSNSQLPSGFRGSAAIGSTEPTIELHIKHAIDGSRHAYAVDSGSSQAFSRFYFPLLYNGFRPPTLEEALESRITVYNASPDQVACVWMTFWDLASTRVNDGLKPASTNCPNGGIALAPSTTMVRDLSQIGGLKRGFVGSGMLLVAANNKGIRAEVVADVDIWNSQRLASYNGAAVQEGNSNSTADDVDQVVYLPVVYKNLYGRTSSYVQIQNTSMSNDTVVKLTFRGIGVNGEVTTRVLVNRGARALDLSKVRDAFLPDGFIGSLTIENVDPDVPNQTITAATWTRYQPSAPFMAYRAVPDDQASSAVDLPLIYKKRNDSATGGVWNARLAILVVDGSTDGDVRVEVMPEFCCGVSDSPTLGARNFFYVSLQGVSWLGDEFVGTGRVVSDGDKRLAVVVFLEQRIQGDGWSMYEGFPR